MAQMKMTITEAEVEHLMFMIEERFEFLKQFDSNNRAASDEAKLLRTLRRKLFKLQEGEA